MVTSIAALEQTLTYYPDDSDTNSASPITLKPWGFTIYRTFYGANSQAQWERIIDKIYSSTTIAVGRLEGASENTDTVAMILDSFGLDARSDQDLLSGLDRFEVGHHFADDPSPRLFNYVEPYVKLFFLADEDVLRDPNLQFLKVAEADYNISGHTPRHGRVARTYFGWMKMPPEEVFALWSELKLIDFESIVGSCTRGKAGEYIEGKMYWSR